MNHTDANSIDEPAFNLKWTEGEAIYQGLGGSVTLLTDLKTMSLDPKHDLVLKSLKQFTKNQEQRLVNLKATIDNHVLPKQLKQEQDIDNLNQDVINLKTTVDVLEKKIEDMEETEKVTNKTEETTDCLVDPRLLRAQLEIISEEVEELKKKTDRVEQSASNNDNLGKVSFNRRGRRILPTFHFFKNIFTVKKSLQLLSTAINENPAVLYKKKSTKVVLRFSICDILY